jgi:hypothetical protein
VIASGNSPVAVFHAAEATGRNPFVTCVGREDEPTRIRRLSFAYDASYPTEPLPILALEFRPVSGSPGAPLDRVIADTGADASALPWADCQRLQLDPAQGRPIQMSGVAGGVALALLFRVWVFSRRKGVPLPAARGFRRSRTHPRPRCPEPIGGVVPWTRR